MRVEPSKTVPVHPWKLLLWAAVASLLFGALNAGEILEDSLRTMRNSLHPQKASGDIVFVAVDEKSLREVGEWPWPRATQAKLIDEATRLGAERIFVDIIYENRTDERNDRLFAEALKRSARVTLASRSKLGAGFDADMVETLPLPEFLAAAKIADISVWYNYQLSVWALPFTAAGPNNSRPSFAAAIARVSGSGTFRLDYSIDLNTVPCIPASELITGRIEPEEIRGKTIVVGHSAERLGDSKWIPGVGRGAGAYVHIIGAETLARGRPVDIGWLTPLGGTLILMAVASLLGKQTREIALSAIAVILLIGPPIAESVLLFLDVVPSLFALAIVTGRYGWVRWKARGLTNSLSGLPNLTAFRAQRVGSAHSLIAARVHNYAEIASSLDEIEEQELTQSVADRLRVAQVDQVVFQGDEGIFAWVVDGKLHLTHHLEALHALFRAPIAAGGRNIDVALTFGAETGSDRSISNRLGSALVAADEAWNEGLRWKLHDPSRDEEVGWRLSLLSQLDTAIDNGEVWLAYQPQVDLRTGEVIGAEALARWTHPEKGPISPSEFIAAAEAHGRITKLTDFVLERAISSAAAINRRGHEFGIAVNLSARLLADDGLPDRVERMLRVHGLNPAQLTLELTETAAITEADGGIALLGRLKQLGVRLAIDDYGTGLSTLDYLKKIPADEIKIDQSFVRSIRVNRSDLIMVQSTIALAHSLNRKVVAEGVEDGQVLEELRNLGCDLVQGFVVGRPMSVRELVARLAHKQQRRVA